MSNARDVIVPHFAMPLRLDGSSFAVVEQDSDEDILQNVAVLVNTNIGDRIEIPDYGTPDQLFQERIDAGGVAEAVDEWEPRATVTVEESVDSVDELMRHVQVQVSDA